MAEHLAGVALIAAERRRQIEDEDWSADHDDQHTSDELPLAAACYIDAAVHVVHGLNPNRPPLWPWHPDWWKPSEDPVRNLVKAGALIAAEIDRLSRLTPRED